MRRFLYLAMEPVDKFVEVTLSNNKDDLFTELTCSDYAGDFGRMAYSKFDKAWTVYLPRDKSFYTNMGYVNGFKTRDHAIRFLLKYHNFRI